jgi:hypothetical protein
MTLQYELFTKFFGLENEYLMGKFQAKNLAYQIRSVASHEYSHGIGVNLTTYDRVGLTLISQYAEEWKATVGGMVLDEWMPYLSNSTPENYEFLEFSVMGHIMRGLRYVSMRQEVSSHPYLRKSIALAKVSIDSGILVNKKQNDSDKNKWEININQDTVIKFYEIINQQYVDLIKIYDSGVRADMLDWYKNTMVPTDYMRDVFEMFNEEEKRGFTLEKVVSVSG